MKCRCGEKIIANGLCSECLELHPKGTDIPWKTDLKRYERFLKEYLVSWSPTPIDDTPYPTVGMKVDQIQDRLGEVL